MSEGITFLNQNLAIYIKWAWIFKLSCNDQSLLYIELTSFGLVSFFVNIK